ncbi:MAG: ABC transporter permease [Methanomassiliicoccus sp.]|nr:ABC transporter permease [Methanomassiliicoccus sp.]
MNVRRTTAMASSNVKRILRDPSHLFLVVIFPVALTVLFATAFGGLGGSAASYDVAVVNLDSSSENWSSALVANLQGTGLITITPYSSVQSARADLSEGKLQAILVIPDGFGRACRSYISHPNDPSNWTDAALQLVLDPGSMVSMQAIPPMVQQALSDQVYGSSVAGPVSVSSERINDSDHLTAFDQMAPGVITFAAVFLTMIVGQSFALDREHGVLRRVNTTPLTSGEFVASHVLSNMVIALVQLLLVFALLFGLGFHYVSSVEGVIIAFALVLVFSICSVGFGLITASLARSPGQATMISFAFIMPQMFLGTFMGTSLSSAAQAVGSVLPAYYVTDGLTTIMLRGGSITGGTVVLDIAMVTVFALAALMIGTALFRRLGNR